MPDYRGSAAPTIDARADLGEWTVANEARGDPATIRGTDIALGMVMRLYSGTGVL
jgi:hypothetical protein